MTASRRNAAALAVAALAFCAFLPALRNGFAWDDELNFLGNPMYRGLGWAQLRWAFTTAYLGPYQPLSWLSSGLDFVLWGMNPVGYHLNNMLLHAANAALVYFLALRLLRLAAPEEKGDDDAWLIPCAAAAALLFAVHPLRVEAVVWATERRTVLAGLFYFSAILCWLDRRTAWAVALFALSLLSKGIGVALPVTLLALDVYPLRRAPALREKIPFFAVAAAFAVIELIAYSHYRVAVPDHSLLVRAGHACYAVVFYALKTVAPLWLSPSYAAPGTRTMAVCAAAAAGVAWLSWRMRERWPFVLPAWAHYLATLAPVLGLLQFGTHIVADRYTYLACAGWPILLMGLIRGRLRPAVLSAAIAALVLGALSWRQAGVWRGSVDLWRHALTLDRGSPLARKQLGNSYYNLGNAFARSGRAREAWRSYYEASLLDPANAMTHNNLGVLLLRHGAREEAAARFCQALRVDPTLAGVEANLRAILAERPRLKAGLDEDCRRRLSGPK